MSRVPRLAATLAGVLLVVTLGGCAEAASTGPDPDPQPTAVSTSAAEPLPDVGALCPTQAEQGRKLRLTNGAGDSIAAVELGHGPLGVVLAHQSDGSLCEWLPYGERLASLGYKVLAFDFAGSGSSSMPEQKTYVDDIRTGVDYLRNQGAAKVVIVGASMGATMSVVAAAAIDPVVDGVVAISPPTVFDGVNAEKAAPSLRCAALVIAGEQDGDYAVYAKSITDAVPDDQGTLLVVDTAEHGVDLVADPDSAAGTTTREAIESFLHTHLVVATASPTPLPN